MKKKWIIFPLVLIVIILFLLFPKKERLVKAKIKEYNSQIATMLAQLKKETFIEEGTISGKLRYIGAHNEPYETEILNDFYIKSNKNQIITTLSTKQNSLSILCESELIGLMNTLKNITNTENVLEIQKTTKTKDEVQITLNHKRINEMLQTDFQEATITFQIEGIIPKIKTVKFQLDDIIIKIENDTINIETPKEQITISFQKNGYFLSNGDNFKMQKEKKSDSITYHIVKNDVALTIITTTDEIKISTSTKKDQFHSMEIILKKEKIEDIQKETGTIEQFPLLKYMKALNIIDWRESFE